MLFVVEDYGPPEDVSGSSCANLTGMIMSEGLLKKNNY